MCSMKQWLVVCLLVFPAALRSQEITGTDSSSWKGQAAVGGTDSSSWKGQAAVGGTDSSLWKGQAAVGGTDSSSWKGQVSNGGNESTGRKYQDGSGSAHEKKLTFSGYVKGALYGGMNAGDQIRMAAAYSELSFRIEAMKAGLGRAYAEVRLNSGYHSGGFSLSPDVREAWVSARIGPAEIRLGKQIIAWGRADVFNPTNTITPMNLTAFSSDEDDTRRGNMLLFTRVKAGPIVLEGVWIPLYEPDVLMIEGVELPGGMGLSEPVYPDEKITHSGFALRADFTSRRLDGSLSYFNGFETQPGINYRVNGTAVDLVPEAYRIHAAGADFSSALGAFTLRGETAVILPYENPDDRVFIPRPRWQWVAGADRSFGSLTVIAQYIGQVVFDFEKLTAPAPPDPLNPFDQARYALETVDYEVENLNRLLTMTRDKVSHAAFVHASWAALYETLHFRLTMMYHFTTEETVISPDIRYDITDGCAVSVGGRFLCGPEGTLNDLVADMMNCVYTELKISF